MTLLPKVKLKAAVNFPATVLDGTGIDVTKANGSYRFDLDFGDFAPPITALNDPAHQNALLWNSVTGHYDLIPASILTGAGNIISVRDYGATGDGVHDDAAAINAALAAHSVVWVPGGFNCLVGSTITLNSGNAIVGMGRNVGQSVLTASGNNYPVITIPGGTTGAVVRHLRIDRTVTAIAGGDGVKTLGGSQDVMLDDLTILNQFNGISLNSTDLGFVQHVTIQRCWNDGFFQTNTTTYGPSQWHLTDVTSQLNNGAGFRVAGVAAGSGGLIVGDWNNIRTFANTLGGLAFVGVAGAGGGIFDIRISNAFIGGDGLFELYLDTYGNDHILSNIFTEYAGVSTTGRTNSTAASGTGAGFNFTSHNNRISLLNSRAVSNSDQGITTLATNVILSGCHTASNGANPASAVKRGIDIVGGNVVITGCNTQSETFGLVTGVDAITVTGCEFGATTPFFTGVTLASSTLVGNRPTSVGNYLPAGVILGNPTGGNAGVGTLNTAVNLLKNNVSYNNP